MKDLSLRVPRGQVFGLLGPNGSGKTTTIAMLLGLVKPSSGTVRLFGLEPSRSARSVLSRMGAIMETPAFYPYLSGQANLEYFQGITQRGAASELHRLLELVGLSDRADQKFSIYSLGMKHRLGIAYALLGDPELLLLDEPTNGLDPAGVVEVRDLIRSLSGGGRSILLCSHNLSEVEQLCDSVAILSQGTLIVQGDVRDLLKRETGARLKTTDNMRATEVAGSLDWVGKVRIEDEHLTVSAPPDRLWELTKALSERGVYVTEMAPFQVSLESYFLEVTVKEISSGQTEED